MQKAMLCQVPSSDALTSGSALAKVPLTLRSLKISGTCHSRFPVCDNDIVVVLFVRSLLHFLLQMIVLSR